MKVLQINTVCGRGSTGRIATDISKLIKKDGSECKIAYGRYMAQGDVDAVKIESKAGNYIHVLVTRLFDRQGFASHHATKKLIKLIDEYKPDIIHMHNLHGYYLNIKKLFNYLSKTNIPIVWTLHDCWPYTGHCVYSDFVGCEKWKTGCHNCIKKNDYPESVLFDNSRRNYNQKKQLFNMIENMTIVTVSDWLKGQVEMSFLKNHNIVRIYNGIDQTVFKPVESNIKEKLNIKDKYMILGVSDAWSERKGYDYFLRLSKELGEDEVIVMVGLGKDEVNKMPEGIIGLERTDSVKELVDLYSSADVVLNPSYEETFGLVTAEALSCGTPVVVLNATASPELVDETCGKIVPKGDYEGIKKALKEVKKEVMSEKISKETCVARAKLFDKEKNYKLYIELYKEILKEMER